MIEWRSEGKTLRGEKLEYSEKNWSHYHSASHRSYNKWLGNVPEFPRRKSVTARAMIGSLTFFKSRKQCWREVTFGYSFVMNIRKTFILIFVYHCALGTLKTSGGKKITGLEINIE